MEISMIAAQLAGQIAVQGLLAAQEIKRGERRIEVEDPTVTG